MRKIKQYFKEYFSKDFILLPHIIILVFISISIFINYKFNFENKIINSPYYSELKKIKYFLFYAIPYLFSLIILLYFNKKIILLKNKKVWKYILFGLIILTIDASFYYSYSIPRLFYDYPLSKYIGKCLINLQIYIIVLLPIYLFCKKIKYNFSSLFSFKDTKPYLILLLLMVPIILIASFQSDFLAKYPNYKDLKEFEILGIPQFITVGIYEFSYSSGFLSVELIFRGFFVILISKILGKEAIMPMVTMYVFLHFGKPLGEAISSLFGGFILGVIAYNTKNINGGIIIHIGIALMMELFAFIQKAI